MSKAAAIASTVADTNMIVMAVLGGLVLMIAIFGALAVLISMLNYKETPVRDRLLLLKEKGTFEGGGRRNSGPFDDLKEALITFSGPLSKKLYGENVKLQKEVKSVLTEAGMRDTDEDVWKFLAQMVATGITSAVVLGGLGFILGMGNLLFAMIGGLAGFIFGRMAPKFLLKSKASKRKNEIRYKLADALDLMVVCVEAGLGLDSTIQKVSEETERMAPEISMEFKRLGRDMNAGIARMEAFQNMGQRAGVDELKSLCAMIIQSDKMGTSIADTLRVYADDMRTKRKQRAEELASKASIKMTFPLVFFIFPPLFIILMGPMAISTYYQFFPPK